MSTQSRQARWNNTLPAKYFVDALPTNIKVAMSTQSRQARWSTALPAKDFVVAPSNKHQGCNVTMSTQSRQEQSRLADDEQMRAIKTHNGETTNKKVLHEFMRWPVAPSGGLESIESSIVDSMNSKEISWKFEKRAARMVHMTGHTLQFNRHQSKACKQGFLQSRLTYYIIN